MHDFGMATTIVTKAMAKRNMNVKGNRLIRCELVQALKINVVILNRFKLDRCWKTCIARHRVIIFGKQDLGIIFIHAPIIRIYVQAALI